MPGLLVKYFQQRSTLSLFLPLSSVDTTSVLRVSWHISLILLVDQMPDSLIPFHSACAEGEATRNREVGTVLSLIAGTLLATANTAMIQAAATARALAVCLLLLAHSSSFCSAFVGKKPAQRSVVVCRRNLPSSALHPRVYRVGKHAAKTHAHFSGGCILPLLGRAYHLLGRSELWTATIPHDASSAGTWTEERVNT